MTIRNSNAYHYNQKEVLRTFVLNFIKEHQIRSLLDIGAGFIETAKIYQKAVEEYLAIEQDSERASKLLEEKIPTRILKFPAALEETFDMVLSSHSIPEVKSEYYPYLKTALNLLNPGGSLVIITFKGAQSTLLKLSIELLGEKGFAFPDPLNQEMMDILSQFGSPVITNITSIERSTDPDDLIRTLCFSFRVDFSEWRSRLLEILETRFKDNKGYFFPHEHAVIVLNT